MTSSSAQIIATLGPSTQNERALTDIVKNGVDVVRVNCSWATFEEFPGVVALVRKVSQATGRVLPIIQDLPGPRMQGAEGHQFDPSAPAVTENDKKWLALGASLHVEYAAISFVGSVRDLHAARAARDAAGGTQKLIAKIERKSALDSLDAIIEDANGIMVARGDLGTELAVEEIPFIQQRIIRLANVAGKPVIVATQMLLSMTQHNTPTRAEVTDVASAIIQGADAVMLSEETAVGSFPVEAVAMMERIVVNAEKHLRIDGHANARRFHLL